MYGAEAGTCANISSKEEVMVRCILIRAAYGGMAGDVTMLKAFAATWKCRSAAASSSADKTDALALCHSPYCMGCYCFGASSCVFAACHHGHTHVLAE